MEMSFLGPLGHLQIWWPWGYQGRPLSHRLEPLSQRTSGCHIWQQGAPRDVPSSRPPGVAGIGPGDVTEGLLSLLPGAAKIYSVLERQGYPSGDRSSDKLGCFIFIPLLKSLLIHYTPSFP